MILIVFLGIAILGPFVMVAVRLLVKAHLWAIAVFLPGGLLIRYGPSQDMRHFVLATCVWITLLAGMRCSAALRRRSEG